MKLHFASMQLEVAQIEDISIARRLIANTLYVNKFDLTCALAPLPRSQECCRDDQSIHPGSCALFRKEEFTLPTEI
jgi:hypothetical protein